MPSPTQPLSIAVEGGGSKTRLLLAGADGLVLAEAVLGPANPLYIDPDRYAADIAEILSAFRTKAQKCRGAVTAVGLAAPMDKKLIRKLVSAHFGRVRVMEFTEGQVALAACGLESGMVLVAGTGSSCHYISRAGKVIARGGCGPQFGDEGSAYWIGREAIAAAMRAKYGGGESTTLCRSLCAFFGIPSMWSIFSLTTAGGHVPAHRVAACAPVVAQCAAVGDRIARDILKRAAGELAGLVARTSKAAGVREGALPLVLSGGVFCAGEAIVSPLRAHLRRHVAARVKIRGPVLEPATGILRLLKRRLE